MQDFGPNMTHSCLDESFVPSCWPNAVLVDSRDSRDENSVIADSIDFHRADDFLKVYFGCGSLPATVANEASVRNPLLEKSHDPGCSLATWGGGKHTQGIPSLKRTYSP